MFKFLLFFLPLLSIAQSEFRISGNVSDSLSGETLPNVRVTLISNGKEIQNIFTNKEGKFECRFSVSDSVKLTINYIGYKTKIIAVDTKGTNSIILPPIYLSYDNVLLEGITVKASKPFITNEIDKIVLNVSESMMANSGGAIDVLKRAPLLTINESDGSITLMGKPVMIYVDGRYRQLSKDGLNDFLTSMPSNTIEKIELISNPGAKYEAAGLAIVNIQTLKVKNKPLNGSFNSGVSLGRYFGANSGIDVSFSRKKFNMNNSISYTVIQNYSLVNSYRTTEYNEKYLDDKEFFRRRRNLLFYKSSLYYDLNKKTTLGFLFQGDNNDRSGIMSGNTNIGSSVIDLDSLIKIKNENSANLYNWNLNFNLNHKINAKQNISIDVDRANYFSGFEDTFSQEYVDLKQNKTYKPPYTFIQPIDQITDVWSIKSDYTAKLKEGTFETGIQYRETAMDLDFVYSELKNTEFVKNRSRSFKYFYSEKISAGYLSFNGKKNKLSYQLGIRAENSAIDVVNLNDNVNKPQNYINIFPSLATQFALNKKQQLAFSYSKRLLRPTYSQLNERPYYFNPFRQTVGNTFLIPSYINTFEIKFINNQWLTLSTSYENEINSIILTPTLVEGITKYRYLNINYSNNYFLDVYFTKNLTKWWNTITRVQYFRTINDMNNIEGYGLVKNSAANFRSTNVFRLSNGLKLELYGYYLPGYINGSSFNYPFKRIDIGLQKTLMKEKADVRLSLTDVFNSLESRYTFASDFLKGDEKIKGETRFLKLTFLYKFGNLKVKVKDKKSGIEKESSRIEK